MWMHEVFNHLGGDGVRSSLNAKDLLNVPFPLISDAEQQAIADYLDDRCSKIDEIIAEATASIEEYKELKQAVIFEAVTKGLNKNVPMKDSNTRYLGSVPYSWSVSKLRWHLRRIEPRNPGNVPVLSLYREYGVVLKDSRDDNRNVTSEDTSNYKYVRVGDFVVNKMKAWQGSVAVSDFEGIVSPAYYVYHFTDSCFNKRYFHYLLRGAYKDEFMSLSGGIRPGQWDLPSGRLDNIYVLIPSSDEQKDIADYLDEKVSYMDALISEKQALIDDLQAYKKSLIYEVVTGKRRVV